MIPKNNNKHFVIITYHLNMDLLKYIRIVHRILIFK